MDHHGPYVPAVAAAVAAVGAVGGAYYAYKSYQNYQSSKLPTEWTQVGTLSNMYIYPVKSCAPVVIQRAECSILGLKMGWLRDRVLMVIDKKNNFVTARALHDLILVQPSVKSSVLTLKHGDQETLLVNLAEVIASEKTEIATVWGVQVPVYDCGREASEWIHSEWISGVLNNSTDDYRLVYYASQTARELRSNTNRVYKFRKNDTGALPDEVPYNLINSASVDDLNSRLKDTQVTHRNFRPNFVLKGSIEAYDEDNWKFVKIGENIFEILKPCTRCVLTTVDPETGVKNSKTEPLETLKSYRQVMNPEERKTTGTSPKMGVQMALRSGPGGLVSLNDPIYVAYK